jgi:phytoene synthase
MTDPRDVLVRMSGDIIRSGSKSFAAASRIFDARTRASVHMLYAWCRYCDDAIDNQVLGFSSRQPAEVSPRVRLACLEQSTAAALTGEPPAEPAFAALQTVVRLHGIPHRYPFELLRGFAMDVDGWSPRTIDDTLTYCYHVAGVVGLMMAMIMGARDDDTLDRACDLGLAFQLTNIARDVMDDATAGRIYLPKTWLDEAGIDPAKILGEHHRRSLSTLTTRLLNLAERYYASSQVGLSRLPLRSAWAVATARAVYREIGWEVMRRGPAAWDRRVSTSRTRKIVLALTAAATAFGAHAAGKCTATEQRVGLWMRPRASTTVARECAIGDQRKIGAQGR